MINDLTLDLVNEKPVMTAATKKVDQKSSHPKDDLIINGFVDLTDDYYCYVCEQVIEQPTYCLTTSVTLGSKIPVAQRLGEALGKRYIVVISDDDYICDGCKTLLDKLDGPPREVKRFKIILRKLVEYTYCFSKDTINVMRNSDHKKLQSMFDSQDFQDGQPPRKRRCMNGPLLTREIKSEPCEKTVNRAVNISKKPPCEDFDLVAIGHEYCFHCFEKNGDDFLIKSNRVSLTRFINSKNTMI